MSILSRTIPYGHNKMSALLAFTSQDGAVSDAVTLGIYPGEAPVSVMPVSVQKAVKWVTGPNFVNTWLCFNLSIENFPIYCAHAAKLLGAQNQVEKEINSKG